MTITELKKKLIEIELKEKTNKKDQHKQLTNEQIKKIKNFPPVGLGL